MNYREPLTKNEIHEHAAHYEQTNPAVYCGTYAKYNNGSLYGMWIDLSTFENYHDFIEFCNRLHANEIEPELMFQDYEHYPEQWYCEGCMGESTFDKIKEYAALSYFSRTSPRGCNAALITPPYGATLIRQAITRRSMALSSELSEKRGNPLFILTNPTPKDRFIA